MLTAETNQKGCAFMKRLTSLLLAASVLLLSACTAQQGSGGQTTDADTAALSAVTTPQAGAEAPEGATVIALSDSGVTVDGTAVSTDEADAVYVANDIVFYLGNL